MHIATSVNVENLTDDELASALALFAAEIARRDAAKVCNDTSCGAATSHVQECDCRCAGFGHGRDHRASRAAAIANLQARARHSGDVTLGATRPAVLADEADAMFGIVHTDRSNRAIDPEDMF